MRLSFPILVRVAICTALALALQSFVTASVGASLAAPTPIGEEIDPFPRPAELEPDVQFWIKIYSEVDTRAGLIHDSQKLGVIYEKVQFESGLSRKTRERRVEKIKRRYHDILRQLASGKRTGLSREEKRVLALWPEGVSNGELRAASKRLRFQLGQSDKFRAGIIRSGAWHDYIVQVFQEQGLPTELAALPHVESSFTPHAYSHVGAAGLWQFTRSTGRRFMRVDHVVDERLDPFRATQAAARLLRQNRETTGSWPLALTAYNHGAAGMRRASRTLGTRDIATIVRNYKGRTFGFASRNFYVEFLAALEVSTHHERYFGKLQPNAPIDYETFELPFFTPASALTQALGISRSEFEAANPALRPAVWRGAKRLPRHYALRIPSIELNRPIEQVFESIPKPQRFTAQTRDLDYRVRRGDTLSTIARRHGVSMSELVAINGLRSRHRIRIGQRLKLPDKGGSHIPAPEPASYDAASVPSDGLYTVRRGDTISRIATRFGLSEQELLAANDLRNRHRIYVGQSLRLHKPDQPASTPAPAASPHPDTTVALSTPPERVDDESVPTTVDPLLAAASEGPVEIDPALSEAEADEPGLLADPNDYGVAQDSTIEVQATETLGHYADWLGIRTNKLRRMNGIQYGRSISIGQRIKLDLSRVDAAQFEHERRGYHQTMQEKFFERFEIEGTETHVTRRGETIWVLAERKYKIPLWLLRQYNPDLDFAALKRGTQIQVPKIKQRDNWSSANEVATAQSNMS